MEMTRKQKIVKEVKSISLIILVVFAFRSTFFEPFKIPSGSMIPTLMIGDFILVNKFAYGFKVPYSDLFWDPVYISSFSSPKRGDVIVFKFPKDPSFNYIKRVIGLPGDSVEVVDNVVYINDKPIKTEEFNGSDVMADMDDAFKDHDFLFFKAATGEHKHVIQYTKTRYMHQQYPKTQIPEGKYFVMGDNRDFSSDSRFWRFVPQENIKGRAMFVWFSMIFPFGEHPVRFRPHRIGTALN
ncbi:MAG: signal peptidase I [Bacteriovoracaceae bacterium]|jgi:signal peptidase I|nr:signal peptidase I [Bacteriovoracaceae bacterium]